MRSARTRAIVFTLNNYDSSDELFFQGLECRYIVYGRETSVSGTPHLQGYVEFKNPRQLSAIRKLHRRWHVEIRRGTPAQASSYCCKSDPHPYQRGIMLQQGARTDLDDVVKHIAEQPLSRAERFELFPNVAAKYPRFLDELNDHYHPPQNLSKIDGFFWYCGPSGTGKSSQARKKFPGAYIKPLNKWWDNYSDNDAVIIEEWSPSTSPGLTQLLKQWADHYPFPAEYKGGSRLIRPKYIVITSNYTMEECFVNRSDLEPLQRRFKVVEFSGNGH